MKNSIETPMMFVFTIFIVMGAIFFMIGLSNSDLIFSLVGAFFACIGAVSIISILYRRYVQKKVRETGIALYTDIVDVILEHTGVNDLKGYRVRTQWLDQTTNTLYYFQSNYLQDDPTERVKNIKKVKVMVNPNNYGQNYMDLPFN